MLQINHFGPIQLAKKNKNKKRHSLGRHVLWVGGSVVSAPCPSHCTSQIPPDYSHMLTKTMRMLQQAESWHRTQQQQQEANQPSSLRADTER